MRPLLLLLSALAFVGCQNVPITGRSQLILVDESEVASMSSAEFSKMKKLPNDPRLAKVKEIGLKIVASARRDDKAGVLPPSSPKCCTSLIDCSGVNFFIPHANFKTQKMIDAGQGSLNSA